MPECAYNRFRLFSGFLLFREAFGNQADIFSPLGEEGRYLAGQPRQSHGQKDEEMSEHHNKEANTGSHVFLTAHISILDAMEDIQLEIYI